MGSACTSSLDCVMDGESWSVDNILDFSGSGFEYTTDGGVTWTASTGEYGFAGGDAVSCVGTDCYSAGEVSSDGGHTWSNTPSDLVYSTVGFSGNVPGGLDCPSTSLCMAVGSNVRWISHPDAPNYGIDGNLATFTPSGPLSSWAYSNLDVNGSTGQVGPYSNLASVACTEVVSSNTSCVAVGVDGNGHSEIYLSGLLVPAAAEWSSAYASSHSTKNPPGCTHGTRPINCSNGDFWHTFTDVSVPGRRQISTLTRTSDSLAAGTQGISAMGGHPPTTPTWW